MKKIMTIFGAILFASFILTSCGGSSIESDATVIPAKPEMVKVEGGTFTMGSDTEKPAHSVSLSNFSIGKYEVTVGQYKAFCTATSRKMPDALEWGWNDNHPMVNVNYNDCVAYCNWLGEKYGGDWRLPAEAEWEYAARGGNKSGGYTYSGSDELEKVAWFEDNAGDQTQSVGRKKPNELGLYDMSGNVWEWCKDYWDGGAYTAEAQTNPKGASSGTYRVLRGGSWYCTSARCRVAGLYCSDPTDRASSYGFRVVLSQ